MTLLLMGANPCATVFDGGRAVAYASVWRVDWSVRGPGRALVLAVSGRVRIIGPDPELGRWLGTEFNRHIKLTGDIAWSEPEFTTAEVSFDLDLATGLKASADDVSVAISGPIERYLTRKDDYDLGGVPHILSTVWIPCRDAVIAVGGEALPGGPRVDEEGPMSSAFIADAEVWCTADHPRK